MFLRKIISLLPDYWQFELKRINYRRQILKGTFTTDEPEYNLLPQFITAGDWVLDIGANVGDYTKRFSELVGPHGRVLAFEPVPATFAMLAANAQLFAYPNITLINAAASDKMNVVGMYIPNYTNGLPNYYEAQISNENNSFNILTIPVDTLEIFHKISLIKIDVEGHESHVIKGMKNLIERFRPVLIIETSSDDVIADIESFGYHSEKLPNSPNTLFRPIC